MAEKSIKPGLLVVSGGLLQTFALRRARKLGIETYLVDGSEHCVAREFADHFYSVSTKDYEGVAMLARRLAAEGKISGVYTQGADVAYTVAYAARAAGLPGVEPQAALNCDDKTTTRRMLVDAGVSSVRNAAASTFEEAQVGVKHVGYPCYIKPADNSASRGTKRLASGEGLYEAFEEALAACYQTKVVLIEAEIPGAEYSVDTIMYKGVLYPAGISDRAFLTKDSYAVHIGSRTPSLLPVALQAEMYKKMEAAAAVLGVSDGAFKGDMVVDSRSGIVEIIEVTTRTSGGHDSQLRKPLSFGIDIIKATMDLALGRPLNPLDIIPRWVKWSSTFAVFPDPGLVIAISGLDELKALPGVADVALLVKVGDTITPYTHSAKRTNFITIVADTYEQLLNLEEKARCTLHIRTTHA